MIKINFRKEDDIMGFRFRKQVGPKGFKLNIGKKGISSTSIKIAKGITYNTKRGLTLGIPGTGISYNFGKKNQVPNKVRKAPQVPAISPEEKQRVLQERINNTRDFIKITGGYNLKVVLAIFVSLILCFTPLMPLGALAALPLIIWFLIDYSYKTIKYKRHLRKMENKDQNF